MSRLLDVIRKVVEQETAHLRGSALGVVTTIFPHEAQDDEHNYEINVRLRHEDLELRKVPMAVGFMGVAIPPKVGDLVLVDFIDGDLNQPVISGRFYHAKERPPLHKADELLFEQRIAGDKTLNHVRFTPDGTILIQRDVKKPEDNSEAKTSIKIDGKKGDIEIKVGEKITILIADESGITITAEEKAVEITAKTLTIDAKDALNFKSKKITVEGETEIKGETKIDGKTTITKDTAVQGKLEVGMGPKTTIQNNEITGG